MCEGEQMETFFRLFTLKALVICYQPMPLHCEKVGDTHWKIRIMPLRETWWGVVQALFSPEDTFKMDMTTFFHHCYYFFDCDHNWYPDI